MTSKRQEKFAYLHDKERIRDLFSGLKLLNNAKVVEEPEDVSEPVPAPVEAPASSRSCSYCQVQFESLEDQRDHFKLDWHRYNLKQSLAGKKAISEEAFEAVLKDIEADEDNEISASDSDDDSEDSDSDHVNTRHRHIQGTKVQFLGTNDTVLSINKCLILDPKSRDQPSDADLVTLLENAPKRLTWAVLMLGGGHFAGAVFRGKDVLVHKTFHAYTVRAKQGGSQNSADNKSGSSHPKSAGASLRRYNEMALMQHIQEIMDQWAGQFQACQLIFYRATSGNRKVLFGAKDSAIDKNDPRLRTIPFQTRRATFKEIKRVHDQLSRVDILGSLSDFDTQSGDKPQEKSPKKKPHRSKSRERPTRALPVEGYDDEIEADVGPEIPTELSEEFDCSVKRKGKRSKNNKAGGISKDLENLDLESSEGEDVSDKVVIQFQNELLTSAKSGNVQMLEKLVQSCQESDHNVETLLNHQFGDSKVTALHLAAKSGHKNIIWTLLLNGADPSVRDKLKKVPYNLAEAKDTRNIFRKFMGEYPDKYDYKTAMIPAPLSKEEEAERQAKQNDKKKAQRQAKREKDKLVKAEQKKVKEEEAEKERFLNLSDREKRALAAERRLLGAASSENSTSVNISRQRCFKCGSDITGKTPFEYSEYKFCSIGCVKKHREQQNYNQ